MDPPSNPVADDALVSLDADPAAPAAGPDGPALASPPVQGAAMLPAAMVLAPTVAPAPALPGAAAPANPKGGSKAGGRHAAEAKTTGPGAAGDVAGSNTVPAEAVPAPVIPSALAMPLASQSLGVPAAAATQGGAPRPAHQTVEANPITVASLSTPPIHPGGPRDGLASEDASQAPSSAATTALGAAALPAALPPPTSHAAASSAEQAKPADVARQVAPALVELAQGPSGSTVTLRLDPAGLGHVQIRIERDDAGSATVQITAEHPETLRLLMTDQPQLHRALDNAGLPPEGRTLGFSLDVPPQATPAAPPGGAGPGFSGPNDGGARGQGGGYRQGRQGARHAGPDDDPAFILPSAWLRAGVDITA